MKRIKGFSVLAVVAVLAIVALSGCAAATRVIDYGHMKTDVAMSESIFLSPTEAAKTVFIQTRNTSSDQSITGMFESVILSSIQAKGYQIVQKPSQATYILQANIRYLGEWKDGMNFQGTMGGASLGALAGLGIGAASKSLKGMAIGSGVGSLIGAGIGLAADLATRVRTELIVIEFQITERLSEEEDIVGQKINKNETIHDKTSGATPLKSSASKTTRRGVTSKEGTKIHSAAVAARAAQVNLNVNEASQRLIEIASQQIAGIF